MREFYFRVVFLFILYFCIFIDGPKRKCHVSLNFEIN